MMNNPYLDNLQKSISQFMRHHITGGLVLFSSVVIAVVWVNSPWAEYYHRLWDTRFAIRVGHFNLNQTLHVWINDGLMTLFFFVIGLQLKREFIGGELSTVKKAALPMVAALGGMVMPALIFLLFNAQQSSADGWGIPMATDIAFALSILSLVGKNIPSSITVYLSALAVADDLGAVLVIAVFYTGHLAYLPLAIAGVLLFILWLGNRLGIRNTSFYFVIGIIIWYFFLVSGVHATISGVLIAFMMPARTKINEKEYLSWLHKYSRDYEALTPHESSLTTKAQHQSIERIKQVSQDAGTPLQKKESSLFPWVTFVIMPLFALSNAGIYIGKDFFTQLQSPISMGVISGLVIGKFVGVISFTWLMIRFKLSMMPEGGTWRHMVGVALLTGVGFTMSIFITGLAFHSTEMITEAKYGIVLGSLLAGLGGFLLLKSASPALQH